MDGPQTLVVSQETLRALCPEAEAEPNPLPPEDHKLAEMLAQLNHRSRRVYWRERRRGRTEDEALGAAWGALPL